MSLSEPLDVGAIVVSWNTRVDTVNAIRSLRDDLLSSGLRWRIIVIDNGSIDGTVDALRSGFPDVDVVASDENLGFVRANNLGLTMLGLAEGGDSPRVVYLLNPDTVTHPGATRRLFDTLMADPRAGMAGAGLRYGDGSFQQSAFMFPGLRQLWIELFPVPGRLYESRFNGRYAREMYAEARPFEVDFVLGATMMARADVVRRVGMLDEAFFMYCEEIDWAWRMHGAGYRVLCDPLAQVTHLGGQSSGQVRPQTIVRLWTSRLTLFARMYPPWKQRIAEQMIRIGMRRRVQQAQRDGQDSSVIEAYQRVAGLAGEMLS